MNNIKRKVVIIGSGISGLYAALKLEQLLGKDSVLLITKSQLSDSNSYYAQGGMVAVLKDNADDSVDLHVKDTLIAGAGLSEEATVRFISENSNNVVKDLLSFGVEFDKIGNSYTLTKEAAHSVNRILHSGGDATGREMETALCSAVKSNINIEVYENTLAIKLLTHNNNCYGVRVLKDNEYTDIYSQCVVLATGGIGQLYKYTTNPIGATGDGIALAYNAGAVLRDMEFVQFHPTAFAKDDIKKHNRFLISEAVRGEGAKLCNKNGIEFMAKYDSRKELAPRDIVARSIFEEMLSTKENNVYLNATVIGKEKLLERFPTIAKKCQEYNIDITKDYIPVAPAAHYFMGGIKTDIYAQTSVKNLYAIGEVASTGLHGANRLASNSLLECVVCAYSLAKHININKECNEEYIKFDDIKTLCCKNSDNKVQNITAISELKNKLKSTMWQNVGIYRNAASLEKALYDIINIEKEFKPFDSFESYELKNMLITSKLITKSAIQRKESRGAHYRTDYKMTNPTAKHSEIVKDSV